jgi:hypothetical protein
MKLLARLEPRFIRNIPDRLEPGVLYVSMEFATAVHTCCCGCGEEIVTPFTPTDWKMTYDGEGISLWPSIGNWNLPCRSHYIIERSGVIEAAPWTDYEIEAERRRDKAAKGQYYKPPVPIESTPTGPASRASPNGDLWSWLKSLVSQK